jgi:hypothetical protein
MKTSPYWELQAWADQARTLAEDSKTTSRTMYYIGVEDALRYVAGVIVPTELLLPVVRDR